MGGGRTGEGLNGGVVGIDIRGGGLGLTYEVLGLCF